MFNPEPNATVTLSRLLSSEFVSSARAAGAVEPRPAATRRPKPGHRSIEIFIVSLPFLAALLHRQMVPTSAGCALFGGSIPLDSDALKLGLFPKKIQPRSRGGEVGRDGNVGSLSRCYASLSISLIRYDIDTGIPRARRSYSPDQG